MWLAASWCWPQALRLVPPRSGLERRDFVPWPEGLAALVGRRVRSLGYSCRADQSGGTVLLTHLGHRHAGSAIGRIWHLLHHRRTRLVSGQRTSLRSCGASSLSSPPASDRK